MKKAIMVAVMAVSCGVSYSAAAEFKLNFDGGQNGAVTVPVQETDTAAAIPARTYSFGAYVQDVDKMNKVLDNTIAYAETRNSRAVVAGLKCLRQNGTPDQKALFVYGPGTYSLPESCQAGGFQARGIVDDVVNCVKRTVCEFITETVIKWACDENGKCMNQPVEVLRKTCHEICE